jgi:hypothetical protein
VSRSMHSTFLKTGLGLTQVRRREVPWTDVCESLTALHLGVALDVCSGGSAAPQGG